MGRCPLSGGCRRAGPVGKALRMHVKLQRVQKGEQGPSIGSVTLVFSSAQTLRQQLDRQCVLSRGGVQQGVGAGLVRAASRGGQCRAPLPPQPMLTRRPQVAGGSLHHHARAAGAADSLGLGHLQQRRSGSVQDGIQRLSQGPASPRSRRQATAVGGVGRARGRWPAALGAKRRWFRGSLPSRASRPSGPALKARQQPPPHIHSPGRCRRKRRRTALC